LHHPLTPALDPHRRTRTTTALHYTGKRGPCIVVSPLVSLMQDQVLNLNATAGSAVAGGTSSGHVACFLGSHQHDFRVEEAAMRGEYRLVYVTPEKVASAGFLQRLQALDPCLVAVDEAHCISEWGHNFRDAFMHLDEIRKQLPNVPIMALTATAIGRVQADILKKLGMRSDTVVAK
jgi:ATP-dependent DNA helicase RecQ/Werner syndrome ATP-dependent helicase